MKWQVYIIKCSDDTYYTGITNNLNARIEAHNSGKGAKSTRGYKWILIFKKIFKSKSKALKFEHELKKNRKKRLSILQEYNEQKS